MYLESTNVNCPPEQYFSGFYYEKQPLSNIYIIRQPSDISEAIKSLKINKLKKKLDRSNYKIDNRDYNNFYYIIENKIYNNILLEEYINTILNYEKISKIKNKILLINYIDKIKLLSVFIFKALNYANYNIPKILFNIILDDKDYYLFEKYAIKLSKIELWHKFAVYNLTIEKKEFNDIPFINYLDFSQYQMDIY